MRGRRLCRKGFWVDFDYFILSVIGWRWVVEKDEVHVTAVAIDFDFIFYAHLFCLSTLKSTRKEKKMEERK